MSLLVSQESTMLDPEMLRPEPGSSGLNGFAINEKIAPFTLADPPNLCNKTCNVQDPLMTPPFFRIPYSLLKHSTVVSSKINYKWVLITVLENMAFAPCQQDAHGVLVDLLPGQFMCTNRELEKLSGVPDTTCRRALEKFQSVGILKQEVKHGKTIITITHPDTCELINKQSDAISEAKVKQKRSTKEEYNKSSSPKKNTHIHSYSPSSVELLSFFESKVKEIHPLSKPRPEKDAAYFEKLLQVTDADTIKKIIIFVFTDEFWAGKIQTPKKLVEGSKDNPDRFALLLHKYNSLRTNNERHAKHPTGSAEPTKRRANELVV